MEIALFSLVVMNYDLFLATSEIMGCPLRSVCHWEQLENTCASHTQCTLMYALHNNAVKHDRYTEIIDTFTDSHTQGISLSTGNLYMDR